MNTHLNFFHSFSVTDYTILNILVHMSFHFAFLEVQLMCQRADEYSVLPVIPKFSILILPLCFLTNSGT